MSRGDWENLGFPVNPYWNEGRTPLQLRVLRTKKTPELRAFESIIYQLNCGTNYWQR